nr:GntP family permease [uncultured Lachnoanaerobaculum sp.]
MFTSVPVSTGILVFSIVLFVVLCYRGLHTATAALLCSAILALGTKDGWVVSITETWTGGVGEFAKQYGLPFMSAGIFSFLMRETRSGEAVGKTLTGAIGGDNSPFLLAGVAAILQLAGINTYIFVVATMAFSLMKAADLPIYIGYAAVVAVPPIVSFTLPGVTALPNILPTEFLGTTTWAAPGLSFATAVVGILLAYLYLRHLIKQARKKGIGYTTDAANEYGFNKEFGDVETPAFWKAILPIIFVIAITTVFQLVLKIDAMKSLIIGMWLAAVLIIILNPKTIFKNIGIWRALSGGTTEMFPFIMMAGCVFGFGMVAQKSACFDFWLDKIMSINVNPYITAWLSVCLIAGLCADGISGMVMWLGVFGGKFSAMPGVNPQALHRIVVSASTTFDSLPHSPMLAQGMAVFRTNYKESYKYSFILTVLFPLIFSFVAVIGAIIFY